MPADFAGIFYIIRKLCKILHTNLCNKFGTQTIKRGMTSKFKKLEIINQPTIVLIMS